MTVFSFAFYMFAVITVLSGLLVTLSRNPVHSVLWLILAFLNYDIASVPSRPLHKKTLFRRRRDD